MEANKPFGLYVYHKDPKNFHVLKDLLQLMKVSAIRKNAQFFYVEDQNSLLPQLSLCENMQLVGPFESWKDFVATLNPEHRSLVNLIKQPHLPAHAAQPWECFLISLLKAMVTPSENLLINMNEDALSPFMVKAFKQILLSVGQSKQVYLATSYPSLWLDCAHSLVTRTEYVFDIEKLDETLIRKHWSVA